MNLMLGFILNALVVFSFSDKFPEQNLSFENAKVLTEKDKLVISTGKIERTYKLNAFGLTTISLRDINSNKEWVDEKAELTCDWELNNHSLGNLVSLNTYITDDEKFTDSCICVEIEFEYPQNQLMLKYIVWAYPDADGLRTQIQLKVLSEFDSNKEIFSPDIMETLSLIKRPADVTAFGYMQGIKTNMNVDILKEQEVTGNTEQVNWANGITMADDDGGIILIKESHKHTKLKGKADVATGSFLFDNETVKITGAGMFPKNLKKDKYLSSWANWVILYTGNKDDAQMALKKFDRKRYPVHPDRDIFIMANTWGTEDMRPECLYAAREENVLKELESVADLGIDILQIDDGWQTKNWLPAKHSSEHQHKDVIGDYDIYPTGWGNVEAKAEELNVKLGLWAAWGISIDKLKWNYDSANFSSFKLDFAHLNTIEKKDGLMGKARKLIKYSGYSTCVNWDVTEIAPRAGYFYGREYGNIYLANRKVATARPPVQYVPYKVLKDAWQLAKYVNLNKFQVTVQNIDMVKDTTVTDAHLHNHPYVVAISLMSSPIFFQETHFYNQEARDQIKPLLSVYKNHREAMYSGYVFPIGDKPDNKSWTGFQNYNPLTKSGYLTILRELYNEESAKSIALKFLENNSIKLIDLLTNDERTLTLAGNKLDLNIDTSAGFLFYKYEILD